MNDRCPIGSYWTINTGEPIKWSPGYKNNIAGSTINTDWQNCGTRTCQGYGNTLGITCLSGYKWNSPNIKFNK